MALVALITRGDYLVTTTDSGGATSSVNLSLSGATIAIP